MIHGKRYHCLTSGGLSIQNNGFRFYGKSEVNVLHAIGNV